MTQKKKIILLQTTNTNSTAKNNSKALMERKWLRWYKNRKPHTWALFQVNTIHKTRGRS